MIRCYRCGDPIDDAEISSVVIGIAGEIHRGMVCKDCAELMYEELTPAMIPGVTVSRLDILKQQAKRAEGKTAAELLRKEIKELKSNGSTVPEIAQRLNISNRAVMDFLN